MRGVRRRAMRGASLGRSLTTFGLRPERTLALRVRGRLVGQLGASVTARAVPERAASKGGGRLRPANPG